MKNNFPLSAQTSVFITSKAQTNEFPYAALCKQKEEDGPKRFFYMSLNNMMEFLGMLMQINTLINRDTEYVQTIPLDKQKEISVKTYRGKKYVCFKNNGKKVSMMNINTLEFNEILKQKQKLQQFIQAVKEHNIKQKSNKSTKESEEESRQETVTVYKWCYVCPESGNNIKESENCYLNVDVCKSAGELYKPCNDVPGNQAPPLFMQYSVNIPLPNADVIMRQIHIYVYKKNIEAMRNSECYACEENVPYSSEQHDEGCCMEWDVAVNLYYLRVACGLQSEMDIQMIWDRLVGRFGKPNTDMPRIEKPIKEEIMEWNRIVSNDLYGLYKALDIEFMDIDTLL